MGQSAYPAWCLVGDMRHIPLSQSSCHCRVPGEEPGVKLAVCEVPWRK